VHAVGRAPVDELDLATLPSYVFTLQRSGPIVIGCVVRIHVLGTL